jgi:hypothetical protein
MGVNDRGHGVGGVVKTIHKFEAEGNEQRQSQQHKGPDAGDGNGSQVSG